MQEYDKSSKWLIQHHGDSILRLCGVRGIVSWRALQADQAAEMLAAGDVGLLLWVPPGKFEGPPEPVFQECRKRIDRDAPIDDHENLLAVTRILAGMRYNDPKLFQILGGREVMIESPVLQEFVAERTRDAILKAKRHSILQFLEARFGIDAHSVRTALDAVQDDESSRRFHSPNDLRPGS
jgi:hypothetical protein